VLLPTRQQGEEVGALIGAQADTIFLIHVTTMPHLAAPYPSVFGGLLVRLSKNSFTVALSVNALEK
jgi:hypothetical protein